MSNSRSQWKGPFLGENLKNTILNGGTSKDPIYERNAMIPNVLVGKTIMIYNGKEFKRTFINREKVGFKFGEFCYTRKSSDKRLKANKKKK